MNTDLRPDIPSPNDAIVRLAAIVEGSDDAIISKGLDGIVLSWNPAAERLFGYEAGEVVGRSVEIIYPPERLDEERQILARIQGGRRVAHLETERLTKQGVRIPVSVSISPVHDQRGSITGASTIIRDISQRKLADEALRESEERFRSVFKSAAVGIGRVALDGRFLEVNEAYARIVGYTREELLERRFQDITYSEDVDADVNLLATLLEGRRPSYHLEKRYVRKDGELVWVSLSVGLARDRSGCPAYCSVVVEDITAQKRAEEALRESEQRFRLLVQGVRDCAIYLLAPDGTVSSWSAAAEQMFGYSEEEIVGRHRRVFFTDEQWADGSRRSDLEEALATGLSEREGWRVRKDGSRFWANVLITAFHDDSGNLRGFGSVTRDFTDRKRAENALRESEERLRASEAALREADRNKDQFLAMLSHELRNPLTPIRNSLYILDRATPGGQQAKRTVAIIQRQIGQLTWLVDDLLDVTRIAHGKIQLQRERIDLNQLAHRMVEDHRAVFAKSDVRLELIPAPAEVWVDGDRLRLAQVLGNLLQNAAKFTPHGGRVTVSVEWNPSRTQAIVVVRDTGRGIPHEMLPRLFQAFSQVDSSLDRSKGGLGLGLALVKGLVAMHGGSVSAASDGPGRGAAFTITLPLEVAAARFVPSRSVVGGPAASRRVLVIEDNEDTASTLREVLEFDEHVVEVAYTGAEGIEKARVFHPEVVLCDISLPEMDGYQVARAMRADPEFARVGLVALSGYAQPEDVAIAREAGFDAHLAKPPSLDALARALADVGNS